MKYYLAYGSNLNVPQMRRRCPHATILGTAVIKDWRLLFRGSKTGAYLTIEECPGDEVPVVVWAVDDSDELALDRYEGFPTFYFKKEFKVTCKGIRTGNIKTVRAFAYIMDEKRLPGIPSKYYMEVCEEGYDTFFFDKNKLKEAYTRSRARAMGWMKEGA